MNAAQIVTTLVAQFEPRMLIHGLRASAPEAALIDSFQRRPSIKRPTKRTAGPTRRTERRAGPRRSQRVRRLGTVVVVAWSGSMGLVAGFTFPDFRGVYALLLPTSEPAIQNVQWSRNRRRRERMGVEAGSPGEKGKGAKVRFDFVKN